MPAYVIGNFVLYCVINAFIINILLALTLVECIISILK